jgi:hypothetical protein
VRGPKHVVKTGKTPVLEGTEWRKLLKSIPDVTLRDLRDRALIATLTYSFARINGLDDESRRSAAARRGMDCLAARERRQAARHAVPSRPCRSVAGLYQCRRHR